MLVKGRFHQGALKAWTSRRKKGWKRKSRKDKRVELLALARQQLQGPPLARAERWLTKRYRSKGREMQVIQLYEQKLRKKK